MASTTSIPETCPLSKVPLHIVAAILEQSGSVQQLRLTILSHRIFRDAFYETPRAIVAGLVANQIPSDTLPFLITILELTKITHDNAHIFIDISSRLQRNLEETRAASLVDFSLSDYAFISRKYAASESLAQSLADEVTPILADRLGLDRRSSNVTPQESFRLNRAFLRYQLLSTRAQLLSTYATRADDLALRLDLSWEYFRQFWYSSTSSFSPWVNEQLRCVYFYLERKVTEAMEELAVHDVAWSQQQYVCTTDEDIGDPEIRFFLLQGLEFLSSVVRAKTYDEKIRLFRLVDFPSTPEISRASFASDVPTGAVIEIVPDLGIRDLDTPLDPYVKLELDELIGPLDGKYDSTDSIPFRAWLVALVGKRVYCHYSRDFSNFWDCAYTMWDYANVPGMNMREKFDELHHKSRHFQRKSTDDWKDHYESPFYWQITDIYLAGGTGYWPEDGPDCPDFGRINGLSEEKKRELLDKWQSGVGLGQLSLLNLHDD
ncbi:uncharacterized protein F4817DRAFT_322972 [Daldinia loculata]|uniref:uncharacterized protein n=1 Tax=Daldinia loculata TaxID=103429 RepID=UPI0020C2AEFB|nr:uncharacterized protein F4817DRAFT_322972 [Daldinia loculata]KAI1652329.1 hypothetical protein F4817DRAFT_322972 [Daldinia loculata]